MFLDYVFVNLKKFDIVLILYIYIYMSKLG